MDGIRDYKILQSTRSQTHALFLYFFIFFLSSKNFVKFKNIFFIFLFKNIIKFIIKFGIFLKSNIIHSEMNYGAPRDLYILNESAKFGEFIAISKFRGHRRTRKLSNCFYLHFQLFFILFFCIYFILFYFLLKKLKN